MGGLRGESPRRVLGASAAVLVAACSSATPEPEPAPEADETPVHGSLATRYRGRFADGSDHDLYQVLGLDVGTARAGDWTAHVLAQAALDLDGDPDSGEDFAFHSLQDTYDHQLTGRLYEAHVDWHGAEGVERLRLGRQLHVDTPEALAFDGLRVESRAAGRQRLRGGAYAGVPVYPYESSSEGDLVFGAFLEGRPAGATDLRLDWMHVEDERLLAEHEDDAFALGARRAVGERLFLEGAYSQLEDRARDLRLRASWYESSSDLTLEALYYRLLNTQKELAVPFDPFTSSLFELEPFQQLGVVFSKGLGAVLHVEAGLDVRRLVDEADAGTFNHEYERYHATLSVTPPGSGDLTVSLTGDVWDGDDTVETWGADVERSFGELGVALGSYYSLFAYDLYASEERDHVRAYYVRLQRAVGSLLLDLRYDLEHDDFDDFHTVRIETTWSF